MDPIDDASEVRGQLHSRADGAAHPPARVDAATQGDQATGPARPTTSGVSAKDSSAVSVVVNFADLDASASAMATDTEDKFVQVPPDQPMLLNVPASDMAVIEAESSTDDERTQSGTDVVDIYYDDDSEVKSITDTLTEEMRNYKIEYGRRYHAYKAGAWVVPNDEKQQDQMDLFHECYNRAKGGALFLAPINPNPKRILDLGTGTGIWAIDVADKYPECKVIGNDLSPIQPLYVPPNVLWEVYDFNDKWTYTPSSFDFVHARAIHGGVNSWPTLLQNALKALKPGGWIEISGEDINFWSDDGTLKPEDPLNEWNKYAQMAFAKANIDLAIAPHVPGWLETAGFDAKTITHRAFKLPIGTWPKKKDQKLLGALFLHSMLQGVEGYILGPYTKHLGYDVDWTMRHIEEVKQSMRNKRCHAYMYMNVFYAQKPLSAYHSGSGADK